MLLVAALTMAAMTTTAAQEQGEAGAHAVCSTASHSHYHNGHYDAWKWVGTVGSNYTHLNTTHSYYGTAYC